MEQVYLIKENELEERIIQSVKKIIMEFEPQPEKEDKLLTTNEACRFLRCSKPTLHRWKKDGILPHVRIGSNIRYKGSDIEKLLNEKR